MRRFEWKPINEHITTEPVDRGVKGRIVDMALNGSGILDTAQALSVAVGTVLATIQKASNLIQAIERSVYLLTKLKQRNH